MSRELILGMSISLDGFVAGSDGGADWIFKNRTEASIQWLVERFEEAGLIAIGHRSYQGMVDYWPTSTNPFAHAMNKTPKVVFSKSGTISPPNMEKTDEALKNAKSAELGESAAGWLNPIVAGKDLAADMRRLKAEDGQPIVAIGGASFASSLIAANLVDVFRLIVHPVALGGGLPMFPQLEAPLFLKLEDLKKFDSGVMVKTYRPLPAES